MDRSSRETKAEAVTNAVLAQYEREQREADEDQAPRRDKKVERAIHEYALTFGKAEAR